VNVDEMDLVSQLKDAAALRPEAYERARTTLRAAMAEPGSARVPELVAVPGAAPVRRDGSSRPRNRRRGTVGTLGKVGIGAGIGAVAAGVAVALVATSTPQPAAPGGSASPAAKAPAVTSRLVTLAAVIKASSRNLPGNASLVIQTDVGAPSPGNVTYNLYTDNGAYYGANNKKGITAAVDHHQNLAGHWLDARQVVAAARYAATGGLAAARQRMLNATPGQSEQFERLLRLSPAARKKLWDKEMAKNRALLKAKHAWPLPVPTDKALRNDINYEIWYNSVNALTEGAGNPQVREGVLRVLSTIPEVTVANSTTGGQAALALTAAPALMGSGLPAQVVTVNARTGMPISMVNGRPGQKYYSNTTFQVSRVRLARVRAGRF
jgi:hypothetical protein